MKSEETKNGDLTRPTTTKRNSYTCKHESVMSGSEYRHYVAEEVCQALTMYTPYSCGIVEEEPEEGFMENRSSNLHNLIDGIFCKVEVVNNWVSCFVHSVREDEGDILIGKFRCRDKDLLDKVVALNGCGAERDLESKMSSNRTIPSLV